MGAPEAAVLVVAKAMHQGPVPFAQAAQKPAHAEGQVELGQSEERHPLRRPLQGLEAISSVCQPPPAVAAVDQFPAAPDHCRLQAQA